MPGSGFRRRVLATCATANAGTVGTSLSAPGVRFTVRSGATLNL